MGRGRLEAFSDGVFAILITIMVLELKVPQGHELTDLWQIAPQLFTYALSFVFVGIYWNNHHHLLHTVERTTGGMMWANLFLLFWISLFPFGCAWIDESHFAAVPVAVYAFVLLMAASAYYVLTCVIRATHGGDSTLSKAVGTPWKEYLSIVFYLAAIATAYWTTLLSMVLLTIVAGMWLVPDRRIERVVAPDA
jgi:uncharacterized membrane protein